MAEIFANKIIGLLVTVGVLAAIYFFAIKPVLDTTNDAFDRAFDASDGIQNTIQESFEDSGLDSFDPGTVDVKGEKAQRLLDCVQKAQPNTKKMQNCVERFGS